MEQPFSRESFFSKVTLEFIMGCRFDCVARCGFHEHGDFELVYHVKGGGQSIVKTGKAKKTVSFKEESIFVYPPKVFHDQVSEPGAEDICLLFSASRPWPGELEETACLTASLSPYQQQELLQLAYPPVSLDWSGQRVLNLRVTALVLSLFESARSSLPRNTLKETVAQADKARQYIQEHLFDLQKMEQVAEAIGVGYDHLRHVFKETYGTSLVRFLIGQRIERAKSLLTHSTMPLKAIATQCCFKNERYFSTAFSKAIRQSPGAFRNGQRSRQNRP